MAVDNLKSGGASDKHSLEIQVVTRVNDQEVLQTPPKIRSVFLRWSGGSG